MCMYTVYVVVLCVYSILCVCMYVYYVCSSVMCVVHSVRARPLLLPCLLSVCVDVSVLVYCMRVVSMMVVMGSLCRTYVVYDVVYVSIVSLGCMYCSRCVLLLMIVHTKE